MKWFLVLLRAVTSLKVDLVKFFFVVRKSKYTVRIIFHVGICAQSHAPGKTALLLKEFFYVKTALLLLLRISRANENKPEETLRA